MRAAVLPHARTAASSPLRTLRAQLVFNLGFLTSAAVLLVGVTTALLSGADLMETAGGLLALWGGSTIVFVLFGVHLVDRLLTRPLAALSEEADTLAAGDLSGPTAVYESDELTHLAGRYRAMAADLLDVHSQIVRMEKLAGIGQLAAGVAHEVRNPLGALGTYVEVLQRRGADPAVVRQMQAAIERIDRTVQSLVDYARPGVVSGAADLNEAVQTAVEFLGAQGALPRAALALRLAPNLPLVRGDRHGLEQVILNLLINASQASPGGRITVGTAAQAFQPSDEERSRRGEPNAPAATRRRAPRPRRPDLAPGTAGALLYVADDGPGVPDADRERIFDPFYTTKEPGEGSGLGLAIVARTVYDAGGVVWVDRAREGGAVFKVFLPLSHAGTTDAPPDR